MKYLILFCILITQSCAHEIKTNRYKNRVTVTGPIKSENIYIKQKPPQAAVIVRPQALATNSLTGKSIGGSLGVGEPTAIEPTAVEPSREQQQASQLPIEPLYWIEEVKNIYLSPVAEEEKSKNLNQIFDSQMLPKEIKASKEAELKEKAPEVFEYYQAKELQTFWDQKNYEQASLIALELKESSNPYLNQKGKYYYEQYQFVRKASAQKIGVLLPKGDKQSERFLNALNLSFGVYDQKNNPFQFIVYDEIDSPIEIEKHFENWVKTENVIAIIGGLKSKSHSLIAKLSQHYQVPFLYFAQKSDVTKDSSYLFQYGLTLDVQIRGIIENARINGIKKMAIIYPNDGYGVEAANLLWNYAKAQEIKIVAVQTYHPNESDFQGIAAQLSSKSEEWDRSEEFKKIQKEMIENEPEKKKKILEKTALDLLSPVYDFDAIFIPDTPKAMAKISASLAYYGIRRLPLYGTKLWVTSESARLAGHFWSNYLIFSDSAYNHIGTQIAVSHPFIEDYKKNYNKTPEQLELSVYEAVSLIKASLEQGVATRPELAEHLSQKARANGIFGQNIKFDQYREINAPVTLFRFDENMKMIPASDLISY